MNYNESKVLKPRFAVCAFLFANAALGQWAEDMSSLEREWTQKIYIKSVDISGLASTEGISEYDAYTLWQYLKKMPKIHSWWPLYDLPGFGKDKVKALRNRYTLKKPESPRRRIDVKGFYQSTWSSDNALETSFTERPERWGLVGTWKGIGYNASIERDSDESWVGARGLNHHAFSITYGPSSLPPLKIICGDIQTTLGTGIGLQTSFSMNRLYQPTQVLRLGSRMRGYGGFLEQRAFRGFALEWNAPHYKWGVHWGIRSRTQNTDNGSIMSLPKDPTYSGYNRWKQQLFCGYFEKRKKWGLWGLSGLVKNHWSSGPMEISKTADFCPTIRLSSYGQFNLEHLYAQWEGTWQARGGMSLTSQLLWVTTSHHRIGFVFTQRAVGSNEDMGGFWVSSEEGSQSAQLSVSSPNGWIVNIRKAYVGDENLLERPYQLEIQYPVPLFDLQFRMAHSSFLRSHIRWAPNRNVQVFYIQSWRDHQWNHWLGIRAELLDSRNWRIHSLMGWTHAPTGVLYRPQLMLGTGFPYGAASGDFFEFGLRVQTPKGSRIRSTLKLSSDGSLDFSVGVFLRWDSESITRNTP